MSGILIVDVDGVCLMWRDTYIQWLTKYNLFSEEDKENYDFTESLRIPGDDDYRFKNNKFTNVLSEIFNDTFLLKKLPPIVGAVDALQRFYREGYIIKAVSSYTDQYESMKSREENLINVFGPIFQEIVSLPLHSSKKEWLNTQNKESFFIEDSIKNIDDAISVGFNPAKCYCIPHEYNHKQYWEGVLNGTRQYARLQWKQIATNVLGN